MKMNRHNMIKSIGALVLTFVLTMCIGGYMPQETMAAGGTVTVSLAKVEGLDPGTEFTFEMYQVGHFEGPGIVLENALADSGVDVDFATGKSETDGAKAERMLKSAKALAQYIDDNKINLGAVGTYRLKPGEEFKQAVTANGLYLVRSYSVGDASKGAKFNWTPQPVYVAVINGDTSIDLNNVTIDNQAVVKIVRTPVPLQHMVIKSWVIPSGSGDVKPEAITVNIRYGGKIIDTVKLTAQDNWSYKWKSEEDGDTYKYIGKNNTVSFAPNPQNSQWTCDEAPVQNFSVEYSNPKIVNPEADIQDQLAVYEITNTYEPPAVPPSKKVKTGDDNNLVIWAAALAAAFIMLVIIYLRRRKSRDDAR